MLEYEKNQQLNQDSKEIFKFNNLAHSWWDLEGEFKTLHHVNPTRLKFISKFVDLTKKQTLDVGCGGGILSEGMAKSGACVTGIDLAPQSIEIAKLHLYESNLDIDYQCISLEEMISDSITNNKLFDVITCMEMLEHVPNPELIIKNCAMVLKNGGYAFFSTLNRNLKSYALAIFMGEYVMNLIPRGTHNYKKFIKPSELTSMLHKHGLKVVEINGIAYNPITHSSKITNNVSVNYIIACTKI